MLNFKNTQFIVLSCDNYLDSRVSVIRETWAINVNCVFLIDSDLYGDPSLIGYNTPRTYDGIQEKYIKFFMNYNFEDFEYYFFTDDDTFVITKNLENESVPDPDELFCLGRHLILTETGMDKWGNNTNYPLERISGSDTHLPLNYLSGGSGFILPRKSCNAIKEYLKNKEPLDIPRSAHGDVSIGFWMRACNINLIPSNNFWWATPEVLPNNTWEKYEDDGTALTFHYVSPQKMLELNSKYNLENN